MIVRENYSLVNKFIGLESRRIGESSTRSTSSHLKKFLIFMDAIPFSKGQTKVVQYKIFLLEGRQANGEIKPYKPAYLRKNLSATASFLVWLQDNDIVKYAKHSWLKNFVRLTPADNQALLKSSYCDEDDEEDDDDFLEGGFSVEEVLRIARMPVSNLVEERARAAAIMMFLSGMRIGAFTTLPIRAVNLDTGLIRQWPSLGVHTKLSKKGTTSLAVFPNIPEFQSIVRAWDEKVRNALSPKAYWYPNIDVVSGGFLASESVGSSRESGLRDDLEAFIKKVGVPYRSPHKFRHGIIAYLRSRATTTEQLEAIALNMLQTLATMLKYGKMREKRTHEIISKLCTEQAHTFENINPEFVSDDNKKRAIQALQYAQTLIMKG